MRRRASSATPLRESVQQLRQEVESLRRQLSELAAVLQARPVLTIVQPPTTPASEPAQADLEWLVAHYEELMAAHRGEAIAIADQRIVASAAEMKVVVRAACAAGHPDALFTSIPGDRPRTRL